MINNPSLLAIDDKIKRNLAQILQRKKQQKQDYSKLDQQQKKEAQQLFDALSIHSSNSNQLKVTSILKNHDQQKRATDKKSVKFAQENNYVVSGENRKWNQKLKNPRKGKYDPSERRALIQNMNKCLNEANLTYEEVIQTMDESDEKIPRYLGFWTKVCSILEDRALASSYKFLKRQLSLKNKGGEWTEQETDLLVQLVNKYGRKWSLIAKQMRRTSQNIRDKYRQIDCQIGQEQIKNIWKFEQLVKYLQYVQKYSGVNFLDENIGEELEHNTKHDEIELTEMKQRRYNSKAFNFHNNSVARKYLGSQFSAIQMNMVNWQKISDKIKTKTIFDCRNKFVQLLQLEIYGAGSTKLLESDIVNFIYKQKPKFQAQIQWNKWRSEIISSQEAKNRWMVMKRHVQGRGTKSFTELLQTILSKFK